jgi:uncharacterized protein YdeI (YjbR/CyaY-like superfamily)
MEKKGIETFCPKSRKEWRGWLEENHSLKQSVWLVYYKKTTGISSVSYTEAVEEALCFGWIDSTRKSLNEETFMQFFCKRKPNSVWSKVNKGKIQCLMDEGLMAQAGYESIEKAKQNGSWIILDDVEDLVIPNDLKKGFDENPGANDFFLTLSRSARKAILQWLVLAKQEATRERRINEIAMLASQKLKPKQFR